MPTLPAKANLDQLRRQAKELVRGARAGDPGALDRIGAVSDEVTLAAAQLAIAEDSLATAVVDPARAEGLLAVATLLLDAGADPNALSNRPWSPLGMLLERVPDVAAIAEQALGAPISSGDVDTVRLLLDAGADPSRYRDGDGHRAAVIPEALSVERPGSRLGSGRAHPPRCRVLDRWDRIGGRRALAAEPRGREAAARSRCREPHVKLVARSGAQSPGVLSRARAAKPPRGLRCHPQLFISMVRSTCPTPKP
jgi:hypothetical protein